jgi:hypothetical protein
VSTSPQQDTWAEAWAERYPASETPRPSRRARLRARFGRGPWMLASAIVFAALLAPAFAIAQNAVSGSTARFSSNNSRYTGLIRNTGSGGATAQTCNTSPGQPACENNVNFGTGFAATYRTTGSPAVFFQTSGSGQATPFEISSNATGMVQYLNANMVGGLTAQQLFSNYSPVTASANPTTQSQGQTTTETATCPTGTAVLSAGASINQTANTNGGHAVVQSVSPSGTGAATATALVVGPTNGGATYQLTVHAICATV